MADVPYAPSPPISGIGGVWRPLGAGESPRLSISSCPSAENGALGEQIPQKSLFPIENYELVYGQWENDVIWDSEAVDHIPMPSLAQIDPNDPNFIIGLPEEAAVAPQSMPGDNSRKVCGCVSLKLLS